MVVLKKSKKKEQIEKITKEYTSQVFKLVAKRKQKYQISLFSFNKKSLLLYCNILKQVFKKLEQSNITHTGPVGIPRKIYKLCVLKSPFVYKKNQELFEIRTYKQVFIFEFPFSKRLLMNKILEEVYESTPAGIDIKIKLNT